jgi:hypothetical protein
MLTATKDLLLPATVTGSWPRPRWYDQGLWGRPLDTALLSAIAVSGARASIVQLPSSRQPGSPRVGTSF